MTQRPPTAHVFVDGLTDELRVGGADGHHLQRVRRVVVGEAVTAADGSGAWRAYAVAHAGRGELVLVAAGDVQHEVPLRPGLVVALAMLPRTRLEWVVAPLGELGVDQLVIVHTERVQQRLQPGQLDRLRLLARESAMQSRRARPLEVVGPVELAELAR